MFLRTDLSIDVAPPMLLWKILVILGWDKNIEKKPQWVQVGTFMQNKEIPHRSIKCLKYLFSKSVGNLFRELLEKPKHQSEYFSPAPTMEEAALEALPLFRCLWSLHFEQRLVLCKKSNSILFRYDGKYYYCFICYYYFECKYVLLP